MADIMITNPRPVRRASWCPQAFPQTNYAAGNKVKVRGWLVRPDNPNPELLVDAPRISGDPVSWMQWRTTLFDQFGNWSTDSSKAIRFPGAKSERVFKVLAEGHEYISGGFFEVPTNQQCHVILLRPRMTNWGVRFVALLGPGTYEISEKFQIKSRNSALPKTNVLTATRSSWLVDCVQPVMLSLSERAVSDVRLRERDVHKSGLIFYGTPAIVVSRRGLVAQLFKPLVRGITTNLEAEVVVRWPTVEFFVEKPK